MAQNNDDSLIKLTQEALDELDKMGSDIEESKKNLEMFEELGVDTSRLRERISWAEKARDLMLNRFGRTPRE